MNIYFIKRVSDGKFFVSTNGLGEVYFSASPSMFLKTPDGVAANLRRLCSDFCETATPSGWLEKNWKNFDTSKLDLYQVVIIKIDILSMTAQPASEFVQPSAIKTARVSKYGDSLTLSEGETP